MDKQEIIEEIRRTANSNNGKALGQERFIRETGIRMNDWYPHHWLRWSEAVKEAGLTPNQLSTAISRETLIEKYIGLIRELGHFPVVGEVRIKAKQDSKFPSHSVFEKFGGKKKLAVAIVNYCRTHSGLEDIIDLCNLHVGEQESVSADIAEVVQTNSDGDVYLMKSGRFYKIGRSYDVDLRHKQIGVTLPEAIEKVHSIRTDDPSGIEAYWHKRFASKRKKGEWFELTRADVNAFKRRKKFM
jgi:hypothetical protein